MPLFMDVHNDIPEGVTPKDVAEAHEADLKVQDQHGVRYINYWLDESSRKIFCLAEAPDAEAAAETHKQAHGLLADEIHPVIQG